MNLLKVKMIVDDLVSFTFLVFKNRSEEEGIQTINITHQNFKYLEKK